MSVYLIAMREKPVRDSEAMAEYQRISRENSGRFDIKPLVVYGDMRVMEGEAPDGVILLEFPSMEEAVAWYRSPSYQAAIPHRQKAADYRVFFVEGIDGPSSADHNG